jgi:spermidine synthase
VVVIRTGTVELRRDRDDPRSVTVLVNGVPSSHLDLDDPARLDFEYMQQMAALIDSLPPGPLDAVHLGAAACTLPRWLEAGRPGSRQLAVDVDALLIGLVRDWFDLPRSPRLRLRVQEARAAVASLPDASVDVVVRDVFAPDVTPDHLTTSEFLVQVRRVLRPGGLYLANCADRPPLALARSEVATARAVFTDVALSAEPGQLKGRRYGNLVIAATTSTEGPALDDAQLARRLRSLPMPARLLHGGDLTAFAGSAVPRRDREHPGRTDDDPGPTNDSGRTSTEAASREETTSAPDHGPLRAGGPSQPAGPSAPG